MLFWILSALLVIASFAALFRTLMASGGSVVPTAAYDVSVYKDQLAELDRDIERGLLSPQEASRARTEISRRLIAASERAEMSGAGAGAASPRSRRYLVLGLGVLMIVCPLALYVYFGSPGLPAQPFAARQKERLKVQQQMAEVHQQLQALRARLQSNPKEVEGWILLGRAYMELGEFDHAVTAFDDAMTANGPSARLLVAKAIALIYADQGRVTKRAEDALRAALKIDPGSSVAQYFIGMALVQRHDLVGAVKLWRAAIAGAPADAPWLAEAKGNLARAEQELATSAASPGVGPTSEDVAAAGTMNETDRNAMIKGMVARLDARLKEKPHDLEGWLKLIRSYGVLGDAAAARDAVARARAAFAGDTDALKRLAAAEKALAP